MNLHRIIGKSDWEKVPASKYTFFQKIAASTYGIISPANIITIIGLAIVVWGLALIMQGVYLTGIILLIGGRLLDILDGAVAEMTRTKSAVGELFDAAADKAGTLLTILVLMFAGIAHWLVVFALVVPQVVILAIVFYKKQKNIRIHPTRQGKLSMALVWIGVSGLIVMKAIGESSVLAPISYGAVGLSFVLGLYAIWQYATGRNQD